MKIFINPGHGGSDPGACGNGLIERDVVLNIGRRVEDYLRAVGYDVKLFQYDGLQVICDDANSFNADLFVSIHCNAANTIANGTETYWSGYSSKGKRLAETIHNQMIKSLPVSDRGVREAGFYVLANTAMPAVLVETAFIDNPSDAQILKDREDDIARAIAWGIIDYFVEEKPLPDVLDSRNRAGKLSAHFDSEEFTCHCCGGGAEIISRRLVDLLENLRAEVNVPIHINSGYRCPKHNSEVGGVDDSQHVKGTAADITIPTIGFDRAAKLVKRLPFDWIGYYPPLYNGGPWFIHVDVRHGGIGSHVK